MLVSAVRKYTRAKKPDAKHQHKESGCSFSFSNAVRTPDVARCTKKDILLFCVIEGVFSFINHESR